MRQLIIQMPDKSFFVVDAEGKDVATIATIGATQIGRHREGLWTLVDINGKQLNPREAIDRSSLKHGHLVTLKLVEKFARETPAGSTHPDDFTPAQPEAQPAKQLAEARVADVELAKARHAASKTRRAKTQRRSQ